MWKYVLIRSLMAIPTVIVVSIIAFFLSRATPEDNVQRHLMLEGITMEDNKISVDNYNYAYDLKAKELGADLPHFYCSIVPYHYPYEELINAIPYRDRVRYEALIRQHISIADTRQYLTSVDELRSYYVDHRDSLTRDEQRDMRQTINSLEYTDDLADIRERMLSVAYEYQDSPWIDPITEVLVSIPKDPAQIQWHIPKLVWHGTDNQYHHWVRSIVQGDFGTSILDAQPINTKIWSALQWTLLLVTIGLILAIVVSIPLALLSVYKANTWVDHLITWVSLSLYAVPVFWLATLMIVYLTTDTYSSWLDIFASPSSFYVDDNMGILAILQKYVDRLLLPIICIMIKDVAYIVRIMKADIHKEANESYALTLRAKGLSHWTTLWKHVLPNALVSLITIVANNVPISIAGTLIIEIIFNIPGMGRLMYASIFNADWNVVFVILILVSVLTAVCYLIGDLVYAKLNPRIQYTTHE